MFSDQNVELNKNTIKNKFGTHLKVNCIILHDVDLIPESDRNSYECDDMSPNHLSVSIRKDSGDQKATPYTTSTYELLIGGVLAIRPHIYRRINGFSNEYWAWGAEDDGKLRSHSCLFRLISIASIVSRFQISP